MSAKRMEWFKMGVKKMERKSMGMERKRMRMGIEWKGKEWE
jgi:hypothetical protein